MEPATLVALTVAGVAAVTDVRTRTIPNGLTYGALVVAFVLGFWPGASPGLESVALGAACSFLPAFALFAMGSLGGGDVKLLAALGALLGYPLIVDVLFLSIVAGGALALILVVSRGQVKALLREAWLFFASRGSEGRRDPLPDLRVPFAVAALVGVVWTLALPAPLLMGGGLPS